MTVAALVGAWRYRCVVQLNDREVYDKLAGELCRFASTLVGPTGADDVVSAVFVRVIATGALSGVDNQRAYLFRAVLNGLEATADHRHGVWCERQHWPRQVWMKIAPLTLTCSGHSGN